MRKPSFRTLWLILVLSFSVSACGVSMIYNRLDWVVPFYVDDFVTLDEDQQIKLHNKLNSLLAWHRSTQLSVYSKMLRKARTDVSNGLSAEKIQEIFQGFDQGWEALMAAAAPPIADLLLTISSEQKTELFQNLKSLNAEYQEKYIAISDEEKLEKIVEKMQDNFSDWLGDLSEAQEKMISTYAAQLVPIHADRYAFRLQWQEQLKQILYHEAQPEAMRKQLMELFAQAKRLYPQAYKDKLQANRLVVQNMLLAMNSGISKAQMAHLANKLEHYAASFDELSQG
ncbi:MAG: DUF6279 family lipoprotein [Gammaproteobacteria bacterium]|nr:DUF6279 family lipoprotein [Gammaproteobacteria bacterium]MDH5801997.1 DUF6279 family lipoprotein [Gammaproteobacteria bacterium]